MKNHKKTKLLAVIFVFVVVSFVVAQPTQAQTLNIDYPAIPVPSPDGVVWFDINDAVEAGKVNIIVLVIYIYAISIWLAAIITFILLVYTSTRFIIAGSSSGERNRAKKRFYNITWGVLILLISWFFLNIINPNITDVEQSILFRDITGEQSIYDSSRLGLTYEGADPAVTGTYSCEWSGSACTNVEPNNCNNGYFAGDCSQIDDPDDGDEFCNEIQNEPCHATTSSTGGGSGGDGGDDGDGGDGSLLTPPNLDENDTIDCTTPFEGPQECETYGIEDAYYLLPQNSDLYSRKIDACSRGRLNLIQAIYTMGFYWDQSGGPAMPVSDLNEDFTCSGVDHATHDDGTHADISVGHLTIQERIDLAKLFVDTGTACGILHNPETFRTEVNDYYYATQTYMPWSGDFARYVSGHDSHFHIRVKKPDGTCN